VRRAAEDEQHVESGLAEGRGLARKGPAMAGAIRDLKP